MGGSDVLTIDQLVHQDDWVCDSERYRCHVCTRNFGSFRRKHHCRRCGEVICRNCTLYKEAELPVIGRSRVRVCMSCILSHSNPNGQPQAISSHGSPRAETTASSPSPSHDTETDRWMSKHIHSPTNTSDQDSDALDQLNRNSVVQASTKIAYELDFSWEHPWPKPPLVKHERERLKVLQDFEVLDTPAEDVFDIICDLASNALKCPIAAVSLIDEDRQWFKASVGLAQNEIPRNVSFCAHTIMSKEPLVVPNTTLDKRFNKNPLVTGAANIRFYAGAPICTSRGHILGTVFVFDTRPRESCDIATLEKLSNVAMKNLEDRKNAVAVPVETPSVSVQKVSAATAAAVVSAAPPAAPVQPAAAAAVGEQQLVAATAGAGADGTMVTGQKMENMLMDLLCRTTETQQQLATQQGAMFQTLGSHTSQIDKLADAVARMEAKLGTQG